MAKPHNSSFISQVATVAAKDLRSELRSKEAINASLSFALVILLLFSFAFEPTAETTREIAGGLLWLVFAFAGALILNRSFARELQNDCLDALIASPLSGASLFLGKTIANFVLLLAIELVCLPVFGIFYNISTMTRHLGPLLLTLALATWGLTVIGTMFSALTVNLRLRELMLPTLVYPVMIPGLMAAIRLTTPLVAGAPLDNELMVWLRLLVAFDLIFTALAATLVETVLVG
ncbi:MAG: heme exporter protein CcmB [Bryobacteraceae bacterium]|nr:heme exporter protein CcmB [Bryobacteraceae bacterium]